MIDIRDVIAARAELNKGLATTTSLPFLGRGKIENRGQIFSLAGTLVLELLAGNACEGATSGALLGRSVGDLAEIGSTACAAVDPTGNRGCVLLLSSSELNTDVRFQLLLNLVVGDFMVTARNGERGLLTDGLLDMFIEAWKAINVIASRGKDVLMLISADVTLGHL